MYSETLTKKELAEISIRPFGITDEDFKNRLIERLCRINDHSLAKKIKKSCKLDIRVVYPERFRIFYN